MLYIFVFTIMCRQMKVKKDLIIHLWVVLWMCFVRVPTNINSVENAKEPLHMDEILNRIGDSFDNLRKADGTKYKGDRSKAVSGALYSTGIFRRINEKWVLRPAEYQVYERRMRRKLEHRTRTKGPGRRK